MDEILFRGKDQKHGGMSCENCFHRDVCYYIEHYGRDFSSDEPCDHFRDLTKMIDVPCAMGDRVYIIYWDDGVAPMIEEAEILEVSTHRVWIDGNYFDYDDFGKIVFHTPEDAQKAIKERESLGH